MRMIAGLDRPTCGTVRVNGKHYPGAAAPMAELGILLDARSVHPGLSARSNLLALARTAGIGRRRVDEVIELAGLGEVAGTRAGGFSLGMGQRLGVAAALYAGRRAGASGFLLKDTQPADLVGAIHTIAAGDAVLGPAATSRLVRQFAATQPPEPPSSQHAAQIRQALTRGPYVTIPGSFRRGSVVSSEPI